MQKDSAHALSFFVVYFKFGKSCCRSASYIKIAAVFDKLSERICSFIGMRKQRSKLASINSLGKPFVS